MRIKRKNEGTEKKPGIVYTVVPETPQEQEVLTSLYQDIKQPGCIGLRLKGVSGYLPSPDAENLSRVTGLQLVLLKSEDSEEESKSSD